MRRLHTQLFFHFLALLFVVGAATSVIFFTGLRGAFVRGFIERLVSHGAGLVAERWSDEPARTAMVHRLADELEVDLALRNPDGAPLTQVGSELPPLDHEDLERARAGAPAVHPRGQFFVAGPVIVGGRVTAILQAAPRKRGHGPSLVRPILTVVVVLFIVAAATAPLAMRISRPVASLTEASRRLGAGELGYRIPIRARRLHPRRHRRPNELDELTRAWNEMAQRIEALLRGQKELLANVSHELRSPLARLRMALELLPRDGSTEARLADIEGDIAELDRLIEDVLTMSRLDATGLPTHPSEVSLRALLDPIAQRARIDPQLAGKEVRVADGAEVRALADGALLKRALWNLVENAGKYGQPPITLAARRDGDRILLSVTDRGGGIAGADRERVFEAFFRVDRAHTPGNGFGVGLALARRIAEVHGGSIRAEPDDDGQGCRVVIELPVVQAPSWGAPGSSA